MRRLALAMALSVTMSAGVAEAQTGFGAAAVYACDAVEICHSTGGCAAAEERIFVIESYRAAGARDRTYIAEPLPGSAGAIFDERNVITLSQPLSAEEIFTRFPAILESPLYFEEPVPGEASRYLIIRSTVQNNPLHPERTLTRFACAQRSFR